MAKIIKKEFPVILQCVYAGDQEDEYCSKCNGVTMIVDGEEFSCKDCQSYTEPEPVKEEPAKEEPKKVAPKPVKAAPVKAAPVAPTQSHAEPLEGGIDNEITTYASQGITTSIKAESGLSIETKKGWYRFTYTEERIIPESADIAKERELLWNDVNNEVDGQAEQIQLMLKS